MVVSASGEGCSEHPLRSRTERIVRVLGEAVGREVLLPKGDDTTSSLERLDKAWYHDDNLWLADTALAIVGLSKACQSWNRQWQRLHSLLSTGSGRGAIYRCQFGLVRLLPQLVQGSSAVAFCMGRWNYTARLRRHNLIDAGIRMNWSLPNPMPPDLEAKDVAYVLSFGGGLEPVAGHPTQMALARLCACCETLVTHERRLTKTKSKEERLLQRTWRVVYGIHALAAGISDSAVRLSLEAELGRLFRFPDIGR